MNLDPRLTKLIHKYQEVFGAFSPPLSCKKLVQMDLELKPEFEGSVVRRRPYPAPQDQIDEIERQIQECIALRAHLDQVLHTVVLPGLTRLNSEGARLNR